MSEMSDATSHFLKGVKELKSAEELLSIGHVSEGLRRCKTAFTYLAKTYLLLNKKPFIGITNPHYIASLLYELGEEEVFRLISSAEVEGIKDEAGAAEKYLIACRKLLELIKAVDPYLDVSSKTYIF
ncbi:MAG: hypothetical protein RMH77_06145 [Sulfolobales archaeon]|nr:hypothetical protein [Sulfolobales archaeon]